MSRSIERVWRQMSVQSLMPVMMLVMVNRSPTDPSRKNTAYGGVLPVPAPAAAPATTASSRSENLLDQQHRDQRAARGRVLYATGRAPQQNAVVRAEVKPPCERRVVQGKTAPAPNS
jgi:hypothetical protein